VFFIVPVVEVYLVTVMFIPSITNGAKYASGLTATVLAYFLIFNFSRII